MVVNKEQMKELIAHREDLKELLEKTERAIATLQDLCEHKVNGDDILVKVNSDSHRDYYRCEACQKEFCY